MTTSRPLTERAQIALRLAEDEARHRQRAAVGTADLLVGLLREGEGMAAVVLAGLGVTVASIREVAPRTAGAGADSEEIAGRAVAPGAATVLMRAAGIARRLDHRFIGTEHLLLALIADRESTGSATLMAAGVTLADVEADTMEVIRMFSPDATLDEYDGAEMP